MSAKHDPNTAYLDGIEDEQIVCEACGTKLTQLFAELGNHDAQGPYAKFRGYCEKCGTEQWSKVIR